MSDFSFIFKYKSYIIHIKILIDCQQDHSRSSVPEADVVQTATNCLGYQKGSWFICTAAFCSTCDMANRGENCKIVTIFRANDEWLMTILLWMHFARNKELKKKKALEEKFKFIL